MVIELSLSGESHKLYSIYERRHSDVWIRLGILWMFAKKFDVDRHRFSEFCALVKLEIYCLSFVFSFDFSSFSKNRTEAWNVDETEYRRFYYFFFKVLSIFFLWWWRRWSLTIRKIGTNLLFPVALEKKTDISIKFIHLFQLCDSFSVFITSSHLFSCCNSLRIESILIGVY